MFAHLAVYPAVLVVGAQRSGTRLVARAITHDTGMRYVDESKMRTDSLYAVVQQLQFAFCCSGKFVITPERPVIHCPALTCHAHTLVDEVYGMDPRVAVVFVHRPLAEIEASRQRIGWEWEMLERMRYRLALVDSARIKADHWRVHQRPMIRHAFDVQYHDLADHPLWVPADQRGGWAPSQVTP